MTWLRRSAQNEGYKNIAEIVYPESLFTGLSLQLMLMRFEIQDAEKQGAGLAPQDMSGIFSVLCALDNRVIAAPKARGYSDAETLRALGQRALEQKRR